MKLFTNKKTIKIVSMLLVFITILNFICPKTVYADEDSDFGGKLFKPIAKLICAIGDIVISGIQKAFIGSGNIRTGVITETETENFLIRYSPGIIFANKVPGLDVNFITPQENLKVTDLAGTWENIGEYSLDQQEDIEELKALGFIEGGTPKVIETDGERYLGFQFNGRNVSYVYEWEKEGRRYQLINTESVLPEASDSLSSATDSLLQFAWDKMEKICGWGWTLFEYDASGQPVIENGVQKEIESSASILQGTVATWYKALRMISIVGLLSVLVYVGIRILISSTGQDKAKYKKMLIDWVAAMCILFILQYIMSFTLMITSQLTSLFPEIIGEQGEDVLISGLRNTIETAGGVFWNVFAEIIEYIAIVILTVVFTIHYLKRLVYMAFLTMIAPLIALTYPLDKIKDGQAQAFSMWTREYIFNALIQPVHLLLYYIFIGTATSSSLAQSNPIYAIVIMAFFIPAEKFIRKMFGFDKASTVGQLGAAAGGAMVMNAINKMGHKSQAPKEEQKNTVRTKSGNAIPIQSGQGGNSGGGNSGGGNSGGGNSGGGNSGGGNSGGGNSGGGNSGGGNSGGGNSGGGNSGGGNSGGGMPIPANIDLGTRNPQKRGIKGAAKALGRKYIGANGKEAVFKAGRLARKGFFGAAGAAALGTIGLAAGVATGDLGNALKYGGAGALAGAYGLNRMVDKTWEGAKGIGRTAQEGYLGREEYLNRQSDEEYYKSEEWGDLKSDKEFLTKAAEEHNPGFSSLPPERQKELIKAEKKNLKDNMQIYRDNGVTDTGKIKQMMQSGLTPLEGSYAIRLADTIGSGNWYGDKYEHYERKFKDSIPATINGRGIDKNKIWNNIPKAF